MITNRKVIKGDESIKTLPSPCIIKLDNLNRTLPHLLWPRESTEDWLSMLEARRDTRL